MLTSKSKTSSHKTLLKTSKIKDCPYCKSGLTETEKDFFPCSCSFQACIDCYKDIIHNKGLCPTCHNPLRLDKLNALNASKKEELIKADSERLLKKEASKKTTTVVVTAAPAKKTDNPNSIKVSTYSSNESAKFNLKKMSLVDLFKVRVLQRNLVYVIGLAPKIAKSDILDKFEHFGQYGKISKIIVNKNNAYNPSAINGPSYSAYLTFSNEVEASIAILAVDQFDIYDRTIRASYGTTKYCTFFLRDQACPNPDCLYLHKVGNERDSFIKDETNSNKSVFIDQQKMAVEHLQKHLTDIEKSITQQKNAKAVFPSLAIVRNKIKEYMAENAQKEKVEPKKEPVKVKPEEETKTAPKPHESVGEKSSPTKEKSVSQSESNNKEEEVKIDDKSNVTPTKKKNEDAKEESAKSDLNESEGSSTSGRSAGKNENSPKKEDEQKQNAESPVKSDNEDAVESDTNNNINEANCYLHIIRSFSRENKDDDTDIKNLEETPYHSEFDKKIFENIYVNWSNHTNSRFKVAQEENPDESEEAGQTDGQPQSDFDIEFNVIYKSIQDYVHLPNTSHTGQPNRKVTEGEDNLQPPKTYPGWEENGQRNTNTSYNLFNGAFNQNITPNGIKANEEYGSSTGAGFGSDQISDQQDGADAPASPDKKGSNSKTKRGKNKKKKGSNSKNSSETNTSSIKNMTDTNKYDKGFESLTLNN